MLRLAVALALFLSSIPVSPQTDNQPAYPSFDYETAAAHEVKPHRRVIPVEGVGPGFNQLRLTLVVSPTGDVVSADATADSDIFKYWPQLQSEVRHWKFMPFEENGKAVTAQLEEYIDLVPPERKPKIHVAAPHLRPDSRIEITLERTGCFGTCPSYIVTVSTDGVTFEGRSFVVAEGHHSDSVDVDGVRDLARTFIAADFYSMDSSYRASVTDNPTHVLSIAIDGHKKEVEDYVGSWVGMPAVITDLENHIDEFARTERWIKGTDGLVPALQDEKFEFATFDAQVMLKEAASRGQSDTVRQLLEAGVPLESIPAPALSDPDDGVPFENVGWLNAASGHLDALQVLIKAGASKNDQTDKDLALAGAAATGDIESVRALIAYGANPNADLRKLIVAEVGPGLTSSSPGEGSVLIYAARSGNPDVVREILRFHPQLEAREHDGKTAMFAAGDYRDSDKEGARVECVRLLAQAGADVNAHDNDGNTPLHRTFLTDVEEELLRLGADVNARSNDGETPIFTTVDDDAIPLFIQHGADLSIRNNEGETVLEAAKDKGPQRQEALRKAIEKLNQPPPSQ